MKINHTADPNSHLGYWCEIIAEMEIGQCIDVDVRDLRDIQSFEHNNADFTPPDRILGNIIGSAYTHSFHMHPDGRKVTFVRHEDTGKRRYNAPDRQPTA